MLSLRGDKMNRLKSKRFLIVLAYIVLMVGGAILSGIFIGMIVVSINPTQDINHLTEALDAYLLSEMGIFLSTVLPALLTLIVILVLGWQPLKDDFKKLTSFKAYVSVVLVTMGCILVLNQVVSLFYDQMSVPENEQLIQLMFEQQPIGLLLTTLICAPLTEELVFRYGLMSKKEGGLLQTTMSILINALIFAGIHVLGDVQMILMYLPLALGVALSYRYSKFNLWYPIGVHFLNNLIAMLFM